MQTKGLLNTALPHAGISWRRMAGFRPADTSEGAWELSSATRRGYRRQPRDAPPLPPAEVDRLVTAIRPLRPTLRGAPEGLPFVWDERTIRSGLNFTLSTSLDALIRLKRAAGRRKDLEAIAELEAIREEREKTGLR
jgi:hypothetical protein